MKAVLLAAGLGTRLRPITDDIPKCLVPVNGKPLLQYWLEIFFQGNIEKILINTHYLADKVRGFVAESQWRDRIELVHETELLGTGGTLLQNRDWLSDGPFMVAHADNLTCFEVNDFINAHYNRPKGTEITVMTFITDMPDSCGIIETDANGIIRNFYEKVKNPPGNFANAAVYIFESTVLDLLVSLGKRQIDLSTEVLPHYLGKMTTFHNLKYHRDIGTPEGLAKAEEELSRLKSEKSNVDLTH